MNTDKTDVIFFGRNKKIEQCKSLPPVKFQDSEIECKDHVKYLRVYFDEKMSWEKQANHVRSKAYQSLNKIRKIAHIIDGNTKTLLLNALVYPHLNYCVNSWSKVPVSVTKKFDSLTRDINQRRIHVFSVRGARFGKFDLFEGSILKDSAAGVNFCFENVQIA